MTVDFKLLIRIQLIIDKLQQAFKIAYAHITSAGFVSLASSRAIISVHSSESLNLRDYTRPTLFCRPESPANIVSMRSFLWLFKIAHISVPYYSSEGKIAAARDQETVQACPNQPIR